MKEHNSQPVVDRTHPMYAAGFQWQATGDVVDALPFSGDIACDTRPIAPMQLQTA